MTSQGIQGEDTCGGRLRVSDSVPLNSPECSRTVKVSDIVLIEAQENYTRIYLAGGDRAFVRQSLKSWDETVPQLQFMRIHRQFIANLHYVGSHDGNTKEGGWAEVRGTPTKIRVGRRIWGDFFERLKAKSWSS